MPQPSSESARPVPLGVLLLALANACGPGLAAWAWTRSDRKAVLLDNVLPSGSSHWDALWWAAASALPIGALYLWVLLRASDRSAALRRLTTLLAPLAASICVPLLYVPDIEGARRLLIITLTLTCSAALALSLARAWPWLREREWLVRLGSSTRAPVIALLVLLLGHCAMFIRLGIVRHRSLGSRLWDLGIFDNLLFHAARGEWQVTTVLRGETFTSAHCSPILQLLGPLYALAPGPETLIVVQAIWLASGAIPLYLLAIHTFAAWPTRRWLGVVFALAWLCHPSLHGITLFDFHDLSLAAPMIVWAIYAQASERPKLWIASIAALLLTREELPFVVIALALYALASGRRKRAALTILAALATLAIVKFALMQHSDLLMPNGETSYRYANRFSKVIPDPETGGATEMLATLLSNPGFIIQHALTPAKLIFMASLAAPTLALFVLGGRSWWALSFGLAFIALGSGSNLHSLYIHYTVFSFPAMFAGAVVGLGRLLEWLTPERRGAVLAGIALALCSTGMLLGERLGALGESQAFLAGDAPLVRELDERAQQRHAWLRAAIAELPAEASVAASNTLGAHVSTRANIYHWRERDDADYLLIYVPEITNAEQRLLYRRVQQGELERVTRWGDEIVLYRRLP